MNKELTTNEENKQPADKLQQLAAQLCASSMVPQRFQNKPRDLWVAMRTAQELGLQPIVALRQIAVIQGTPSIFGDLPMALAWQSGKLESLDEYFLDDKGEKICEENKNLLKEPSAAVCKVKRKDDSDVYVSVFTVNDAKKAGLFPGRAGSCWAKYPSDMMKYRARARALKAKLADAINGIAIAEYDFHTIPGKEVNERTVSAVSDYNQRYLGGDND